MPWKLGGNFESVQVTCKTSWQECTTAVADYLWFEIVSDVVDFLTKEGIIWTLAIAIISTVLFCVNSRKGRQANNNVKVDKHILRKVGYKIQDLELKVNVLTYKMQYGTWPLPHQIYSLNPKKLQKIRMTLSNPVDRRSWVKHVLLSPPQSDMHAHHTQRGKLSADCSSIETSKSTSDQSVNMCSRRPNLHPRDVSAEESDLSKSGDFTLQRRDNMQLLPLVNECKRRSSKVLSVQDGKSVAPTSNAKLNPCQDFTNAVHRCRSFLKELGGNGKRSSVSNYSSGRKVSSLRDACATEQPAPLTAEKREISDAARETARRKDTNEMKHATGMGNQSMEGVDQVHRQSDTNASSDAVVMMSNDVGFQKQLFPDFLMSQPAHNVRPSRETLYQVRRRLESLHNVLRTYEDTSRSSEKQELADQLGEVNTFVPVAPKIEEVNENKVDADHDSGLKKALPCIQCSIMGSYELDHTEESSSSLAECSSDSSSKVYQYSSDVALRSINSKEYDQCGAPRLTCMSDLAALANSCNQLPPFCSTTSHVSQYRENRSERITRERDISDHSWELESSLQADENATSASFDLRKEESAVVKSEKTRCILSPGGIPIERYGLSSMKEVATEEISDAFDEEHYHGNRMIVSRGGSRSKISMRSDQERKSTALLLQEALLFKQALLTRVESENRCLTHRMKEGNLMDEPPTDYETQIDSSNHFPTIVVGIETEGPIMDTVHGRLDKHYIQLEMKQRSDLVRQDLRDVTALACCESEGVVDNEELVHDAPSEYFSFCDLTVPSNGEIASNMPLKPPIYEKVISIMIPVDVGGKDAESSRRNSREDIIGDLDGDIIGKRLPVMLELEDLILERLKDIRDYMDIFLRSQDQAISQARRALQGPDGSVSSRCSDTADHVILRDQFAVPSKYDGVDRAAADSSKQHELEDSEGEMLRSRRRVSAGKGTDTSAVTPSELPSDTECPKSTTLIDLKLILGQSGRDYSTDTRTEGGDDVTHDLGECTLSSSSTAKEETLDGGSSNDAGRHDLEASADVASSPARVKRHATRRLHRTNSRVKAKSDMSLATGTSKNSNVSLRPKRSRPSLIHRDTLERIRRTLRQSDGESHDDTDESAKCRSESRPASPSKSLLLPQGISARSCIPILRNRLEAARMRQSNTRSPTRSPLTMLWRENARAKSRTTAGEATRRRHSVPMEKGLCAEEAALKLTEVGAEKNGEEIAGELGETNATHRDSGDVAITNNSDGSTDDRHAEPLRIDEERTNKRLTGDGSSDAIMTESMGHTASKTLTIISMMASDDSQKNYPANPLVLSAEDIRSMTDLPKGVAVEKKEQEVTVKPSITDTCTSMTDLFGGGRRV